jgi:hypothetical protein
MAEPITIVKYKSLDGHMYNDEASANRADSAWREEHEFDLAQEIASYQTTGERFVARQKLRWSNPTNFPKLLIENGKHSTAYHLIKTPDDYDAAYFSIFKFCKSNGFYEYNNKDAAVSDEILRSENKAAAIAYVQEREGEYERVDVEEVYTYS